MEWKVVKTDLVELCHGRISMRGLFCQSPPFSKSPFIAGKEIYDQSPVAIKSINFGLYLRVFNEAQVVVMGSLERRRRRCEWIERHNISKITSNTVPSGFIRFLRFFVYRPLNSFVACESLNIDYYINR